MTINIPLSLSLECAGGVDGLTSDSEELRKSVEFATACGAYVTQVDIRRSPIGQPLGMHRALCLHDIMVPGGCGGRERLRRELQLGSGSAQNDSQGQGRSVKHGDRLDPKPK